MGWKVYGQKWETGELASSAKFQTCELNSNVILKGIRTWVVVVDNPVFTDLNCKIYSNDDSGGSNSPNVLLHTSTNSLTKAQVITDTNGIKEIYFTFDNVPLVGDDKYNFVINGSGYAPTTNSFLAWRQAYPDPVYSTGHTPVTISKLSTMPFELYFIAGDL